MSGSSGTAALLADARRAPDSRERPDSQGGLAAFSSSFYSSGWVTSVQRTSSRPAGLSLSNHQRITQTVGSFVKRGSRLELHQAARDIPPSEPGFPIRKNGFRTEESADRIWPQSWNDRHQSVFQTTNPDVEPLQL